MAELPSCLLLLDGLDAELLAAFDANGEALAPELQRFCSASLEFPQTYSAMLDPDAGLPIFLAEGSSAAVLWERMTPQPAQARLANLRIVAPDSLGLALHEATERLLVVHRREDPARTLDEALLLRTDPTPWAGAAHAENHRQQRENRLQRGRMLWQLRAQNRDPRQSPQSEDLDWLARYRLAELERELAPALAALRAAPPAAVILLSALHGVRTRDDDLSSRARRVPSFVWPATAATQHAPRAPHGRRAQIVLPGDPSATSQAHWALGKLPGEAGFAFARWDDRLTLRCEGGRLQLYDRRFDPEERFDLSRSQTQLLQKLHSAARIELLGEAILHLRSRTSHPLRLRLLGVQESQLVELDSLSASEQAGALLLEIPRGSAALSLRLDAKAEPLRIQGDVRQFRIVLGHSAWHEAAQLRFDLNSGALLAALGSPPTAIDAGATSAPQLVLWIERR